jgi:kumamolisin
MATIPGSDRVLRDGHRRISDVDPSEAATVTVYLRRPSAASPHDRLRREDFASRHGTAPSDLEALRQLAAEHGLSVHDHDPGRTVVSVSGRLGDLAAAFGADLGVHADPSGATYRGRTGSLSVPDALNGVVTGVFGFDQGPAAQSQVRWAVAPSIQYTGTQIASDYGFPAGTDGTGQCVALIELGGGFTSTDMDAYFSGLGLTAPTVTAVGVDGGTNSPTTANGPDAEVMLDIEIVGAAAPKASIAVYFAPNTDQGFIDAVTTAVHDTTNRPSVVSISWGGPESTWTAQAMTQMESAFTDAAALGVTIVAAAGDNGSTDGVTDGKQHVDFPASAPHALACGGTTRDSGAPEVVWNGQSSGGGATGGGISDQFALPSYQDAAHVPPSVNPGSRVGRGVPDVAADADPNTGYSIRVDGQAIILGGTSAVAPLWAALLARCSQALGTDVGFVHPKLYAALGAGAFHDITSGNNGAYDAGAGWDPCTGLGTPDGTGLLAALKG